MIEILNFRVLVLNPDSALLCSLSLSLNHSSVKSKPDAP